MIIRLSVAVKKSTNANVTLLILNSGVFVVASYSIQLYNKIIPFLYERFFYNQKALENENMSSNVS